MADVAGSLKEIEYAADVLKADGFGITTQYGDLWPGDPKFRPIWEELHRRNAVVYVHPSDAPCCTAQHAQLREAGYQRPVDRMADEYRTHHPELMTNGVTSQLPGVKFIFSQAAASCHC